MPVTFKVAAHSANPLQTGIGVDNDSPRSLLRAACEEELNANRRYDIIQSSVSEAALPTLQPRPNGFVHTVMQAYATHHHLKIRPDDVWIAILSQLNIYVNTHAEALRNSFVPHTGQKRLTVWASGDVVDFGSMAHQMTDQIRQNLLDETLVDWILPDFTTTDFVDTTVCSILMMSTLKAYFKYEMGIICGIPSVTLDGEKMDWVKLLERLDRLDELGTEAGLWAAMLRPILMRFVSAFDGKPDVAFWGNVMHRDGSICGLDLLSGWITAFCVWSSEGVWQGGNPVPSQPEAPGKAASQSSFNRSPLTLDGVAYSTIDVSRIHKGYGEVNVHLIGIGNGLECTMVAGHLAMAISQEPGGSEMNTVSPAPQWFMFVEQDAAKGLGHKYTVIEDLKVPPVNPPVKVSESSTKPPHSKCFAKLKSLFKK